MSDDKKVRLTLTDEDMVTSPRLSRRTLLAGVGVALGTVALAGRSPWPRRRTRATPKPTRAMPRTIRIRATPRIRTKPTDKDKADAEDKDKGDAEDDKDKADAEADKGEAERDAD